MPAKCAAPRATAHLSQEYRTPAWEQRKLGDCGSAYGGLSGKTKEDFGRGTAKFVPYTNVFDNPITDSNRLESIEKDSKQNEVRYGDALFTVSSETPGEVGMSSVWLSDQPNVYLNSFALVTGKTAALIRDTSPICLDPKTYEVI